MDDALAQPPNPPAYNTRYALVGVGHWSYGAFKIEPTSFEVLGQGDLSGPEQPYEAPPPPPPSPAALRAAADQCPADESGGFDTRPSRETLTIGTMNAEWLFDGVDDPSPSP